MNILKKFVKDETSEAIDRNQRVKVQSNNSKPRPTSSLKQQQSDTPLSKANLYADGYSEDMAAELRKEMDNAIARY